MVIENKAESLDKDNRYLRLKNSQGKSVSIVREVYRRENIPCQSSLCLGNCNVGIDDSDLLPSNVTHYIIPDCQVAREYLEVFEAPEIHGIIFTQTAEHCIQYEGSKNHHNRFKRLVKDKTKGAVIFHNEFQKYAYCERESGESNSAWQSRSTFKAAEWFFNHLAGQLPVVMVTNNDKIIAEYGSKIINVHVMKLGEYLQTFWKQANTSLMDLFESLTASVQSKTKKKGYSGYLPTDVLEAGLKTGRYIQGHMNVNKSNASEEAFVRRKREESKEDSGSDILIHGMSSRNRAVHGDVVVVELLPRSEWKGRSNVIKETTESTNEPKTSKDEEESEDNGDIMPTGYVVGITQRNWREYVAAFAQDEKTGQKGGKVLVIPWDYRIPKIRISTRQVEKLKDDRIIVRIDSWDIDSQYPNGHFIRSLGKIGELETEISAILIENNISVPPFSDAQMKELPVDTPENPWNIEDVELKKRRDLRDSHLIFSIDPKGCEDVDDTLSVRHMQNGNIELGVHIADVTHFVKPGSLTDQEAKKRSTTVYLADRRYDMLPGILSANLCSLISGVDRYAVSVIWELDSKYEVVEVWYGKTIIRSQYKLFYELAQLVHDGASQNEIVDNVPELQGLSGEQLATKIDELVLAVNQLMTIARQLKRKRVRGGALELESVEVQVQLSETKSVEDLTPKDHMEIHDTIAECMIFANHWVAKKVAESFSQCALLRHHPLPRDNQFGNLKSCAEVKGFSVDINSNKTLAESLDKCVDPADSIVNKLLRTLATQAMSNAAYFSTGSLPNHQFFHYGLALDLYTHFTSPIRRYADVIVHRQLMAAVEAADKLVIPGNKDLSELSDHINQKHRASQYAQRDSQELFQCLYFKGRDSNDECCIVDAVIFQLRNNGVYVFIPRYGIKGPVYLRSKDGQVIHVQPGVEPEWTGGTIQRTDHSIIVNNMYDSQTYTLLDHITVRISLKDSRAHSLSVRLELLYNTAHISVSQQDEMAKKQKAAIIKEVSEAAEESRLAILSHDLGANFHKLKEEYGQTSAKHSLYHMFESFKETALKTS
ncbi:DIS3-like exonuclease 1 [Mytilus edulis]|uniref:DIS3-like exonuclease 1 n=1 Tax=Mytilus edulis TaxID=6550 RepID=UPI0039F14068